MPRIVRSTVISRPAQIVFAYLSSPEKVAALIPGVVNISGVQLPIQRGSSFRWEYLFLGQRYRGIWTVDEFQPPLLYSAVTSEGINSRWSYSLQAEHEMTRLTLEVEYAAPESLLKQFALSVIQPYTGDIANAFLNGLRHAIERSRSAEKT